MDLALSGKRAIVAGASSGLGLGCARALAAEGAVVAIGSRTKGKVEEAAASIVADGGLARPVVADVSTPEGATAFVDEATDELGGVDIVITNAGGPPAVDWEHATTELYRDALNLNLMSVIAMCTAAMPAMQAQRWGRIVAITSSTVRQPISNLILSNTARAGATGFLKTLATDVAADGITVNSLQPGLHLTPRVTEVYSGRIGTATAGVPTKTAGDADDFGRIAAFLCSDHAKFITGAAIPVDGGASKGLQ